MKLLIILSSSLVLLFSVNSCTLGLGCEEPPTVFGSAAIVSFIDRQSGKYLYIENNPLYNRDSLKIFDDSGAPARFSLSLAEIPNSFLHYYQVAIYIYKDPDDKVSFSHEICKNFIIKYSQNETDTLKTCFKSRDEKCGSGLETLKFFHKGTLISSSEEKDYALIDIYKD